MAKDEKDSPLVGVFFRIEENKLEELKQLAKDDERSLAAYLRILVTRAMIESTA